MAGPTLPAPASAPAAATNTGSVDTTYPDSGTDPSVHLHQIHHDLIHWILNAIDKDSVPTAPILLAGVVSNNQTGTTYTLVLADAGKVIELNNGSAISLRVPTNASVAFPIGTCIELWQQGAGTVTVSAVTPATTTIRSPASKVALAAQYASATLRKRATDEWALEGNLA